ncbi:nucleoside deaminase, partial [Salmonella enterica subsp. enterica serovar Uganda]|nr:nucleoside deaminase [Salmonella enterica subsp. enterica serovar Uganda]
METASICAQFWRCFWLVSCRCWCRNFQSSAMSRHSRGSLAPSVAAFSTICYPDERKLPAMTCNHKQLDEVMMAAALAEACASVASGGMPFGAVLVVNDEIASRGYNRQIQDGRFLAHAEMECLESFYRANSDVALNGATLIATEAPCPMCAGAAVIAGISR